MVGVGSCQGDKSGAGRQRWHGGTEAAWSRRAWHAFAKFGTNGGSLHQFPYARSGMQAAAVAGVGGGTAVQAPRCGGLAEPRQPTGDTARRQLCGQCGAVPRQHFGTRSCWQQQWQEVVTCRSTRLQAAAEQSVQVTAVLVLPVAS